MHIIMTLKCPQLCRSLLFQLEWRSGRRLCQPGDRAAARVLRSTSRVYAQLFVTQQGHTQNHITLISMLWWPRAELPLIKLRNNFGNTFVNSIFRCNFKCEIAMGSTNRNAAALQALKTLVLKTTKLVYCTTQLCSDDSKYSWIWI